MSHLNSEIAVIGIDIGKNSFHVVGQDRRGAIVLRQKWTRSQVEARLAMVMCEGRSDPLRSASIGGASLRHLVPAGDPRVFT